MKNAAVPPEQLMSELQAGQPVLDCRADCGLAWANNRQQAAALDATAQWRQLALLVMQIGYMDDLTYYYLGRAAENLGYLQPAQRYYRIAEQISVTNMSCHQGEVDAQDALGIPVSECNGYVFPDALYPHLEVVESQARVAVEFAAAAADASQAARGTKAVAPAGHRGNGVGRSGPGPGCGRRLCRADSDRRRRRRRFRVCRARPHGRVGLGVVVRPVCDPAGSALTGGQPKTAR